MEVFGSLASRLPSVYPVLPSPFSSPNCRRQYSVRAGGSGDEGKVARRKETNSWKIDFSGERPATPLLDTINYPIHMKNLSTRDLDQLAAELRADIVYSVSKTAKFSVSRLALSSLSLSPRSLSLALSSLSLASLSLSRSQLSLSLASLSARLALSSLSLSALSLSLSLASLSALSLSALSARLALSSLSLASLSLSLASLSALSLSPRSLSRSQLSVSRLALSLSLSALSLSLSALSLSLPSRCGKPSLPLPPSLLRSLSPSRVCSVLLSLSARSVSRDFIFSFEFLTPRPKEDIEKLMSTAERRLQKRSSEFH
ncbi:hypothetical protein AAC387_Pa09g1491 [Persea americana]